VIVETVLLGHFTIIIDVINTMLMTVLSFSGKVHCYILHSTQQTAAVQNSTFCLPSYCSITVQSLAPLTRRYNQLYDSTSVSSE